MSPVNVEFDYASNQPTSSFVFGLYNATNNSINFIYIIPDDTKYPTPAPINIPIPKTDFIAGDKYQIFFFLSASNDTAGFSTYGNSPVGTGYVTINFVPDLFSVGCGCIFDGG